MTSRSPRSKRRSPSTTLTGSTLDQILFQRGLDQGAAATAGNTSRPYMNQVITGKRRANAAWLDLIADALELNAEERRTLHRAGATDAGFKLE